jgi:hypothetical protein
MHIANAKLLVVRFQLAVDESCLHIIITFLLISFHFTYTDSPAEI